MAAILCLSLLAFVGCGNSNDANTDNGANDTVTEETKDGNDVKTDDDAKINDNESSVDNGNGTDDNGSLTEDMADGARDVVDDTERAVDDLKNDAKDAADTQDSRTKE